MQVLCNDLVKDEHVSRCQAILHHLVTHTFRLPLSFVLAVWVWVDVFRVVDLLRGGEWGIPVGDILCLGCMCLDGNCMVLFFFLSDIDLRIVLPHIWSWYARHFLEPIQGPRVSRSPWVQRYDARLGGKRRRRIVDHLWRPGVIEEASVEVGMY